MNKTKIEKWEEAPREDLRMIPEMQAAGWETVFSPQDKLHKRVTPYSVPHVIFKLHANNLKNI